MSTTERFAVSVSRVEDLAPAAAAALQPHFLPDEVPQQIIFAPRQSRLSPRRGLGTWFAERWTPSWVLARTDERLLVVTIPEAPKLPEVTVTPLADLLWLELGTILLHSWVAWSWVNAGQPQRQRVYFNTVSESLFWDMVNAMRRTIISQAGLPPPSGERHYSPFEGLPLKFRNLIPFRLMLPGEQPQVVVYQPAIWGRHLGVLRRQRTPATVVVLTREHLLIAQDDLTAARAAYGIIARYCPRDLVRRLVLEQTQNDLWLNVAVVQHGVEEILRLLFEPGAEPALRTLITQL